MNRTPMPSRDPRKVAEWQQRSRKPMARGTGLTRAPWSPAVPVLREGTSKNAATTRSETGFSRRVKLLVRTRAGSGDPEQALCEACGLWLGRRHGQVHHRVNRGAGGCTDEVINGPANAALLCGTPFTGCHGLATALKLGGGFVIGHGTTPEYDPRNVSILLASPHGSGVAVWLSEDGRHLFEAPEGLAA